jgi:hypothetical protein
MPLLIDVEAVPDESCDHAIELMAKAYGEGGRGMFRPLENRWARYLCEQFTARMGAITGAIEAALKRFLSGDRGDLQKASEPWLRWDGAEFEAVREHLNMLDADLMTLDDWQLLISWLIQRYLPDGVITSQADFLATRAVLLGKIQVNLQGDHRLTDPMLETLTALLPTRFAEVPLHALTPTELAILHYGRAHAAENIRSVTGQTRHRMATVILEHQQARLFGQREGSWQHASVRLFDEFAITHKDMRRIAVTESGELVNQGYIAATTVGHHVTRIEAYKNTCSFCAGINGKTFEVVAPDAPDKNGDTQIWPGKTNVGRSASPMKRVGDLLVERSKDELWWPAAGVQHPHCRGAWVPVTEKPPAVSQQFFDMLQDTLNKV